MRAIVAAAGTQGDRAVDRLAAAGYLVERIRTLPDARVRAATAPVMVVGELADAQGETLRDAIHDGGTRTPLVHLSGGEGFTVSVSGPDDDLAAAVALARHVGAYNDAVDAFFERCRQRATGSRTDEAAVADDSEASPLVTARQRADESLARTRRVGEGIPYDHLFEG